MTRAPVPTPQTPADRPLRLVIALGGNALLRRGQKPDADVQERNVADAVAALAPVLERHEVVLTHGNGPQVGVLALQSASDPRLTTPYPFDVIGAQTQGMIGYWLLQALQNAVPDRQVAAIINQTLVDKDDPKLAHPTKFVGEVYDRETAAQLAAERGWTVRQDGDCWRRVIGSPDPLHVIEADLIHHLLDSGVLTVCAGGGGVPVVRNASGRLDGIEAVIDKDGTAALLAMAIGADGLLILTDVDAVYTGFGTPDAASIRAITAAQLRAIDFPAGSMGPKVDAACRFVEHTGGFAVIGSLADAAAMLSGDAGTCVMAGKAD